MSKDFSLKRLNHRITGRISMSLKPKSLLILTVVLAAVLFIGLAGGCGGACIEVEPGFMYHDTITTSDILDVDRLRAHVYCLNVDEGDTYSIELQALSDTPFQVWECNGREAWILEVYSKGSQTVNWTFDSAGKKEIWIEAYEEDLPAEYNLCITKVEF